MEENYKVYMHTFPNGKVYIGITLQSTCKRWSNRYKNSHFMNNAIQKYGWENVKHEILYENLTKEEAEQKEIELISQYKSNQRKYGYNIANGGMHKGKHSEETIEKMRIGASKNFYKKGHIPWNKGIPRSIEEKEKISKALKGKKPSEEAIIKRSNSLKGHIVTKETIKKIQETKKTNYPNGYKHSKEVREKMSKARTGTKRSKQSLEKQSKTFKEKYLKGYISPLKGKPSKNRKKIIQYDLEQNKIKEWESISEASKKLNIKNIGLCCKGRRKTASGYIWRYK